MKSSLAAMKTGVNNAVTMAGNNGGVASQLLQPSVSAWREKPAA